MWCGPRRTGAPRVEQQELGADVVGIEGQFGGVERDPLSHCGDAAVSAPDQCKLHVVADEDVVDLDIARQEAVRLSLDVPRSVTDDRLGVAERDIDIAVACLEDGRREHRAADRIARFEYVEPARVARLGRAVGKRSPGHPAADAGLEEVVVAVSFIAVGLLQGVVRRDRPSRACS